MAVPEPHPSALLVAVGVADDALADLASFLDALPGDVGAAYIVAVPASASGSDDLTRAVAAMTSMPVSALVDGELLCADIVYVAPPYRYVSLQDGMALTTPFEPERAQAPLDWLLRSLAEERRELAIAVVLGGGKSGSAGLLEVTLQGGLALAQDPLSLHAALPVSDSLVARKADFVQSPVELAATVATQARSLLGREQVGVALDPIEPHLTEIVALTRAATRLNFEAYKQGTIVRRIRRRMGVRGVPTVGAYVALLRGEALEAEALARDLLVRVTQFFRDPDAWDALIEQTLRPLVEATEQHGLVRVWVAGCATGQEAYSLAMALIEVMEASAKLVRLQIFATDIGGQAATVGREGVYSASAAQELSRERLERFFVRLPDDRYQVGKVLRECVVFSEQDLLSDPPFSRMDLVVCRNVLIYLEPEMQQRVIALFHFGLLPGGYLFLGPAETVGRHEDLFAPLNKRWRIFQRLGPARATRIALPFGVPGVRVEPLPATPVTRATSFARIAQQILLERFAPAAVLIATDGQILFYCGPTERFLVQPGGVPTSTLAELLDDPLRRKIQGAIQRVLARAEPMVVSGLGGRDPLRRVQVTVSPVAVPRTLGATTLLVVFEEAGGAEAEVAPVEHDVDTVAELEHALGVARHDMQVVIEELETNNEELKAANEEVTSMNEELQATNEELETSKEELQSLNEELTTLNVQLQTKLDELEAATADLRNLLVSTHIATLFLDTELRIRRFTPAITDLMRMNRTDVGRLVSDLKHAFTSDDLSAASQRVLETLVASEAEVHTLDGRWFLRRIQPYRSDSNHVAGVVVTFNDFTTLKHAATALAKSQERLRQVAELGLLGIAFFDPRDGRLTDANEAFLALSGKSAGDVARRRVHLDDVTPAPLRDPKRPAASPEPAALAPMELEVTRPDGARVHVLVGSTLLRDSGEGALFFLDISARKRAELELSRLAETLELRVAEGSALVRLLSDAAVIANEASEVGSAFKRALARIGGELGYQVGHVWLPRTDADGGWEDAGTWWCDDEWPDGEPLTRQLRDRVLPAGVGLAARAAAQGGPVWTREIEHDLGWLDRRALMRWPVRSAMAVPLVAGRVIAVMELLSSDTVPPTGEQLAVLTRVAEQLACALERDLARRAVRRLAAELIQVEERQRGQMADTLHDEVGQTLTAAGLQLTMLRGRVGPEEQAMVDTATRFVEEALHATRNVTVDLMPPPLRDLDVVAGFRWIGRDAERRFGLFVEVVVDPALDHVGRLDQHIAAPLFRGIRELLHNIAKHADVVSAELRVALVDGALVIEVEDAGVGFAQAGTSSYGLASLRERMSWLGGDLRIESVPGEQTCVSLRVPWKPEQRLS